MKALKKVGLVLAVAAIAALAFTGCAKKEASKAKYLIATDTTFAPFEFQDAASGKFVGIDMDLLEAIAKDQNFQYELQVLGFNAAVQSLEAKQSDGVIAGMSITDERKLKFDFSEPYFDSGVVMGISAKDEKTKTYADLKGKKVAVKTGTEGATFAESIKDQYGFTMAYDLLVQARDHGLTPYGISFHVGSQQRDIGQWNDAIAKTKYLIASLEEEEGIKLQMINMGGGFPASYVEPTNDLKEYASEITRYLRDDFGDEIPQIVLEPGRSLVGNSGILISEVVLISRKNNTALNRWVYQDTGKFNGLIETLGESIKYPVVTLKDGPDAKYGEVIIAGPTCDSMDIMYEDCKYKLPLDLKIGDRLYWLSTGAYTSSYASVEFNGFPPIKTYFME